MQIIVEEVNSIYDCANAKRKNTQKTAATALRVQCIGCEHPYSVFTV